MPMGQRRPRSVWRRVGLAVLAACLSPAFGGAIPAVAEPVLSAGDTAALFAAFGTRGDAIELQGVQVAQGHAVVRLCQRGGSWCGGIPFTRPGRPQGACPGVAAGAWCLPANEADVPAEVLDVVIDVLRTVRPGAGSGGRSEVRDSPRCRLFDRFAASHLLAPFRQGAVVAPGWTLARVAARCPGLELELQGPAGRLWLAIHDARVDDAEASDCAVRSRSQCLRVTDADLSVPEGDPAERTAVEAIGRALVRNDAYNPWDLVLPESLWRLALLAVFAAGLVLGGITLARRFARGVMSVRVLLSLAAVTLAGALLRWHLSPWTFLHEFFHVAHRLATLYAVPTGAYGEAGPALFQAMNRLTGLGPDAIFATSWLLSSMTVPALAILGRAVSGRWSIGLVAALLLALLPQHLRFSASEVLPVVGTFFLVSGLAMAVLFARRPDASSLAAATCLLFLATQSRPEGIVAPFLGLLAVPAVRDAARLAPLRRPGTVVAILLTVGGIVAGRLLAQDLPGVAPSIPDDREVASTFLALQFTPRFLIAAFAVGLAAAFRHDRYVAAWLLAGFVACTLLPRAFFGNPIFNLRTQIPALPLAVLAAAWGLVRLVDGLPASRVLRGLGAAAILGLALSGLASRIHEVTVLRAVQQEWAYLARTVPGLPDGPGMRLVGPRVTKPLFPQDLLWEHGKLLQLADVGECGTGAPETAPAAGDLFYLGMYCHLRPGWAGERATPGVLHPDCERLLRQGATAPLDVAWLPGPLDPPLAEASARGPFLVGFYRIGGQDPQPASRRQPDVEDAATRPTGAADSAALADGLPSANARATRMQPPWRATR